MNVFATVMSHTKVIVSNPSYTNIQNGFYFKRKTFHIKAGCNGHFTLKIVNSKPTKVF